MVSDRPRADGDGGPRLNPRRRRGSEVSPQQVRRVLENPIAIRVLEVAIREPGHRPTAQKVRSELAGHFADLQVRQVAFHLGRLRDVDLLPRPIAEVESRPEGRGSGWRGRRLSRSRTGGRGVSGNEQIADGQSSSNRREEERELWEELNRRVIDSAPKGTLARDAPWQMSVALTKDPELRDLFVKVFAYTESGSGYIHDRMQERSPDDPEIGDLYGFPKSLEEDQPGEVG